MAKNIVLKSKRKVEETIYFDYVDAMMILCYRYIGNIEDAEEIMNNAFLKVFKHISKFKELYKNSFSAWIKRIMINECLMHLRKNKGFNIISLEDLKSDLVEINDIDSASMEELLSVLTELPTGYRTVFNLYAIEGYKHFEIADLLNITESTSRTQLHKARNMLQKIISERNLRYG